MLKAANVSVEEAMSLFNGAGVTHGLLVPTETGYAKSIMDATIGFRDFLLETEAHDYSKQLQGPENKVLIPAQFVYPNQCIQTLASLYRPHTKKGDPRIWFTNLKKYCKPTDLLVVVNTGGKLSVFNMSNAEVVKAFGVPFSYPYEILSSCSNTLSSVASELFGKMMDIHRLGFVQGISHGNTNVGMTLEHLLGIPPNSSKKPDYKGIELKSRRGKPNRGTIGGDDKKVTLFTNAPDWKRSPLNAKGLLGKFGYQGEHGLQLYCTVSNVPNPQGLFLNASDEVDLICKANTSRYQGDAVLWALSELKSRLSEKHRETFWLYATSDWQDGKEFFRYDFVKHTRKPNSNNLGSLFDAGVITVDYAMHLKASGSVRDHGYIFKASEKNFRLIFPIEKIYDLSV